MKHKLKLDTNLTPEEIPGCGVLLTDTNSGYIYIGVWQLRDKTAICNYPEAVCGKVESDHRRCERCMRAVGAIW